MTKSRVVICVLAIILPLGILQYDCCLLSFVNDLFITEVDKNKMKAANPKLAWQPPIEFGEEGEEEV